MNAHSPFPYDRSDFLTLEDPHFLSDLRTYLLGSYHSDMALGDASTSLFENTGSFKAIIRAKQGGFFCGGSFIPWFFEQLQEMISCSLFFKEGMPFLTGDDLVLLEGPPRSLLRIERTVLNFLQRTCGIATSTHQYVQLAKPIPVSCTRKTLYGRIDKYAVHCGGGLTHRLCLGDAPMIKDNHFALVSGNAHRLLDHLDQLSPDYPFVTIEVGVPERLGEFLERIPTACPWPIFILLDNCSPTQIQHALHGLLRRDDVFFEASGGITLSNLQEYAKSGADVLSVGALTHSAPALDLSMVIL